MQGEIRQLISKNINDLIIPELYDTRSYYQVIKSMINIK